MNIPLSRLTHISFHKHHKELGERINPRVHWRVLLGTLLFVNMLMIGFNVYLFYKIGKGEIFTSEQAVESTIDSIDREALDELVEVYERKEQRFAEIRAGEVQVADPIK